MAKVKIQGNASGTGVLTVTAPNTSTDRTITLPDSTGTLATTDDNGSQLDHSGSKKIEATATGVDVTGIAVTDGITSSGNITFDNGNSSVSIKSDGANGSYIQYGTDEYLRFLYDNGANETMRLHDSGYVTMPQGVTLGNGNTYAAANTLDDYEEGTHTVTANTGGGSITLSSTNNKFTYTKIGRQVTIVGRLDVSAISSPTGELSFSLPFVVADLAGQNSSTSGCQFVWYGTSGDAGLYVSWADDSESVLYMRIGTGTQPAQAANLARVSTEYRISFSYMTN